MIYFRRLLIFFILFILSTGKAGLAEDMQPAPNFIGHVVAIDTFPRLHLATGEVILLNHLEYIWEAAENEIPEHLQQAKTILTDKLLGQDILIQPSGNYYDALGQIHALIRLSSTDDWLNYELLREGISRAQIHLGFENDFQQAIAAESQARIKQAGLWKKPDFQPFDATHPTEFKTASGFILAHGIIKEASLHKSYLYLNFGDNRRQDFTIGIPQNDENFDIDMMSKTYIAGRQIEVRGFLERWNGPFIRLQSPEQLKLLP